MTHLHRLSFGFLMIALTVCVAAGQDSAAARDAKKEALGKEAIAGYAANLNSFPFYQCRYCNTLGTAESVEKALKGILVKAWLVFDNRLLVDGANELYEGLAPPPDFTRKVSIPGTQDSMLVGRGRTERYLKDGKREMVYEPSMKCITLFTADQRYAGIGPTPLGMRLVGHRNTRGPDSLLKQKDRYEYTVLGQEEIDGRPVITVRFKDRKIQQTPEGPIEEALIFSFDRGKGYLPIRMTVLHNNTPRTHISVTARACSKGRWFPERTLAVTLPGKTAKPGALYDVSEILLLDLDVDNRPAVGEFSHSIPAGTTVKKLGENIFFRLPQEEKIGIENLPKLFDRLEKARGNPGKEALR